MRRGRQAIAVVVCALAALASLLASTASAQELTAEELGLQVTAGFVDQPGNRHWLPVEVSFAPTRVFAGELAIEAQTAVSRVVLRREIEVPAGSEKVYRFVVPPTEGVRVTIEEPGRDPLTVSSRTGFEGAPYTIGVVGSVPGTVPTVTFDATQTVATWAGVDPEWLEVSPRALHGLSTLVIASEQIGGLSDVARTNLATSVASGLDLVVTATTTGPVDLGLPWEAATAVTAAGDLPAVVPTEGARVLHLDDLSEDAEDRVIAAAVPAGRGRLTVTSTAPGTGPLGEDGAVWGELAPLSTGSVDEAPHVQSNNYLTNLAAEALSGAGLTLPSLPWLTAFLLGYVLLVGPVNWLVLRRLRRPELAWATVPAVTFLFGAGGFLAATGSQPPVGIAGAAQWWLDGVGGELAAVVVRSPTPGSHEVALDGGGWDVIPESYSGPVTVARDADAVRLDLPLESLQVGTVLGWRPATSAPPIDVTAEVSGDELTVEVTNTSDRVLSEARIVLAAQTTRLRDLEPGERRTETISLPERLRSIEPYRDPFEGLRDGNGRPAVPIAFGALLQQSFADASPGTVVVTGAYEELEGSPASTLVDGRPAEDLGRFVAVGVTPRASAPSPVLTPRALLTRAGEFGGDLWRISSHAVEGNGRAVLRYRLPAGGDTLVATLGGRTRPVGGIDEPCFQDGDVVICQGAASALAQPEPPPMSPEDCPPDATCRFDGQTLEVCTDDECTITVAPDVVEPGIDPALDPFVFGGPPARLSVWNHAERTWQAFDEVFVQDPDGEIVAPAADYVSPLGEFLVRAEGELFPFDFSHRGVTLRTGGLT